jgi:signal transduction histidine kinase
VIKRHLRDARELTNKPTAWTRATYLFVGAVAALTIALNVAMWERTRLHPDNLTTVVYLLVATALLNSIDVRLERGRLTLSAIAIGASAILLNALDATVVGVAVGIPMLRRGPWPILANAVMAACYACLGAAAATELRTGGGLGLGSRLLVLAISSLSSWALVSVGLSIRTGEPIPSIIRHNFTGQFYLAFGYFTLASLLASYLLDGTALGYLLAAIVFVLALALTDTIAGRRVRRVLESELSDADRHLFHSRAVEGVVHNVRNHIATAVGYLKEIDLKRLDPVDKEAVETATAAASDAVTVLRTLSQGATPRVNFARDPVDLNELVALAMGMARPRARTKEVELAVRESPEEVKVRADPLLLREVITNLLNNAIDAAPQKGKVDVTVGRRGNSSFASVADDGPGVADENRHHLFEPHFTTKEAGTGLGLFMSYGVVREHQGELTYNGSNRGAVFTVILPPFGH